MEKTNISSCASRDLNYCVYVYFGYIMPDLIWKYANLTTEWKNVKNEFVEPMKIIVILCISTSPIFNSDIFTSNLYWQSDISENKLHTQSIMYTNINYLWVWSISFRTSKFISTDKIQKICSKQYRRMIPNCFDFLGIMKKNIRPYITLTIYSNILFKL